jgi:hypothetical protein
LPDRRQKRLVFQASFFCISVCLILYML